MEKKVINYKLNSLKNEFKNNLSFIILFLAFFSLFIITTFAYSNYIYYTPEIEFLTLFILVGIFLILYSSKNRDNLHKIAFLIILIFGILMVFLAPPMCFPDEAIHFSRSEFLSEGILHPTITEEGYYVNDYFIPLNTAKEGLTIFDENDFYRSTNDKSKSFWPTTTQSPFYSYIPSTLGILLAKFLNLTAIWALWLGRLANLLFYLIIATFAIKKASEYKLAILLIATMPLTISQVSSYNYDAFILTITMLIIAYLVYMYKNKVTYKEIVIFLSGCLLIGLIKPPYIFLTLLLLIVPKENFKDNKMYENSKLLIVGVFIIAATYIGSLIGPSLVSTSISNTASSNISLSGQLNNIIANPLILIDLLGYVIQTVPETFINNLSFFHFSDFKGIIKFNFLYALFFILFSLIYKNNLNLRKKKRFLLIIIFLLVYLAFYGILYLQDNTVGSLLIRGIQARYFIPIIALLPMILGINNIKDFKNFDLYVITIIISFLSGLLLLIISHYYLIVPLN